MSYTALYRKYRPQKFSDVVGQEHVKTTLLNALTKEKVAHAYLFCGPRGVGKTTVGRLLAYAVNCEKIKKNKGEPCGKCDACKEISQGKSIDLIEIDAASNRGIDEIRELREKVKYTPTNLKHLVFIIDEVHMLTIEAFNALLKTLEEPPAHAIFVLATTDPQKVPPTILSRCQRFDFKRLSKDELQKQLTKTAKKEKAKISIEALEIIAGQADGSSRDGLSILGQVIVAYEGQKIDEEKVQLLLGLGKEENINNFVTTVLKGDLKISLELANEFINNGYAPHQLIEDVLKSLRKILLVKSVNELPDSFEINLSKDELNKIRKELEAVTSRDVIGLINSVLEAKENQKYSQIPQLPLEMAIISFLGLDEPQEQNWGEGQNQDQNKKQDEGSGDDGQGTSGGDAKKSDKKKTETKPAPTFKSKNNKAINIKEVEKKWSSVLNKVQAENYSLGSLLKSAQPTRVDGNKLVITCQYEFHKELVEKKENQAAIENCLGQECGAVISINCEVGEVKNNRKFARAAKPAAAKSAKEPEESKSEGNLVNSALDILGGEVT